MACRPHHGAVQPAYEEPDIVLDRDPVDPDVVDFGGTPKPRPHRRRLLVVAGVAAALVIAGIGYLRGSSGRPEAAPSPSATTPAGRAATATPSAPTTAPTTYDLGHPILGVTGAWELFGYTGAEVVRVEFAAGRITRTPVPRIASSAPSSVVATAGGVVVRPLDNVTGYLVPDGQPAQPLQGRLAYGGPVLPGPRQGTMWVPEAGEATDHLLLVDVQGRELGERLDAPPGNVGSMIADGSGYALFSGLGGVYSLHPGSARRIANGSIVAVGPTRWLTQECDQYGACRFLVVDKRTGATHEVGLASTRAGWPAGAISPDGHWAALINPDTNGMYLLDLDDSTAGFQLSLTQPPDENQMVWSPASDWVFVSDQSTGLHAISIGKRAEVELPVQLPAITQLTVRA